MVLANILIVLEHLLFSNPDLLFSMASKPSSHLLRINAQVHITPIKLSSSNYLFWKSQLLPLFLRSQLALNQKPLQHSAPNIWRGKQLINGFFVSSSPLSLRKPLLSSLVSPLHVTFGSRWRLCSVIIRKLVHCIGSLVGSAPIFQLFLLFRWLSPLSPVLQI